MKDDLRKRRRKREQSNLPEGMRRGAYLFCFIMCIPAIYGILKYVFTNGYTFFLAFSYGTPFKDAWTLEHFKTFFKELFSTDGEIFVAIQNTLMYFAIGIIKSFLCYIIAYFLFKKIPFSKVYRFIFFLPNIVSSVILVNIYIDMIRQTGPVYTILLNLFHYELPAYNSSHGVITGAIILYLFLFCGFGSTYLIYIGAMNRIPKEMLESARLDGCSSLREFFSFILPLTWGTFSTFLVMSIAGIFTASGPILYFSEDASLQIQTVGYYLFNLVRSDGGVQYLNQAAAVGLIFTLVTIPIVIITRYIATKLDTGVTY